MLDKLIDNAVDFSPAGALIIVRLRLDSAAVIEVDNPDPPFPHTSRGASSSHCGSRAPAPTASRTFGLGLYIVRLIAEFHGGEASAANLPDGSGVRFAVRLSR